MRFRARDVLKKICGRFRKRDDRGFALIATTILLGIVMAFAITVLDASLSSRRASKYIEGATDAVLLAEAGVHKAIFCLKATDGTTCGGSFGPGYAGETNVGVGTGKFTVAGAWRQFK